MLFALGVLLFERGDFILVSFEGGAVGVFVVFVGAFFEAFVDAFHVFVFSGGGFVNPRRHCRRAERRAHNADGNVESL